LAFSGWPLTHQEQPQCLAPLCGFKLKARLFGLDPDNRTLFSYLGSCPIIQSEFNNDLTSGSEFRNTVNRDLESGKRHIMHFDQTLPGLSGIIYEMACPDQIHRFSNIAPTFHQHAKHMTAFAGAINPDCCLCIYNIAKVSDHTVVTCRTEKDPFFLIV
jgi:hypothetical protein